MKLKSGQSVINAIKLAFKANRPVLLKGGTGVGKSELIGAAAQELGVEYIARDLSLLEPVDLTGLPLLDSEGKTVNYAAPSFLPRKGQGIICFEELNRSERYVVAPCLQLLTTRTLNDYKLPPGWLPAAAINPSDEGNYLVNELDPALLARFIKIDVEPNVDSWLSWAEKNAIHPAVVRYVRNTGEDIFKTQESNPRAWHYVSDVLHAHESGEHVSQEVLLASLAGLVGTTHGHAFLRTYRSGCAQPIDAQTVLMQYQKIRSTVRGWTRQKKTDLLAATAHAVQVALQHTDMCAEIAAKQPLQQNLAEFIADIPPDIGKVVQQMAKSNGALS